MKSMMKKSSLFFLAGLFLFFGALPDGAAQAATVQDDFNRANNAVTLGQATSGETWQPNTGTWGIENNTARVYQRNTAAHDQYAVVDSTANGFVQATMSQIGQYAGLTFRYVDPDNNWKLGAHLDTANYSVSKFVSGVQVFEGWINKVPQAGDVLRVETQGTTITVKINGIQMLKLTGQTDHQDATKAGLRTWNDLAVRFDNFSASKSLSATCGNGTVDEGEACDGNIGECIAAGGHPGAQICSSDCSSFQTCESTANQYCGDGIINGTDETCDYASANGWPGSCTGACQGPEPYFLNAGHIYEFTDPQGRTWKEDGSPFNHYQVDGNTVNRGNVTITPSQGYPQDIYRTERWGLTGYHFEVANGAYTVRLHFAETYCGVLATCTRIFNLSVEGQALQGLNVATEAGGSLKGIVKEFSGVQVTDGVMDILFTPVSNAPMINAIEIINIPALPCGNGLVDRDEACDSDGAACTVTGGYDGTRDCLGDCSGYSPCVSDDFCGDDFVNGDEVCDNGASNGLTGFCAGDCMGMTPYCGDDIRNLNEACDGDTRSCVTAEGYAGSQSCLSDCSAYHPCQSESFCGDQIVNGDEVCDNGPFNGFTGYCDQQCGGTVPATDAPIQLISPAAGTPITTSSVLFAWTDRLNVAEAWITVGTKSGGADILNWEQVSPSLSRTVSGYFLNGKTLYFEMWYRVSGKWVNFKVNFETENQLSPISISSPVPGSTLNQNTQLFSWTTRPDVKSAWIAFGTKPGGTDILKWEQVWPNLSKLIEKIPLSGKQVYFTMWYDQSGTWIQLQTDYKTATHPQFTAPAAWSLLDNSTVMFEWTNNTTVTEAWFAVGTKPGGSDILKWEQVWPNLSKTVSNIPLNGNPVYAEMWYRSSGVWAQIKGIYNTVNPATDSVKLTSPAPEDLLGSSADFQWTDPGNVTEAWVSVGTSLEGGQILKWQQVWPNLSITIQNIPQNGQPVYFDMWYRRDGMWKTLRGVFRAQEGL